MLQNRYTLWDTASLDPDAAYINIPSAILDQLLDTEEGAVTPDVRQWSNHLLDEQVYSGYGFTVIRGTSYRDLSEEHRRQVTKNLAFAIGKPLLHKSAHLNQDVVCDIKDTGYRFKDSYSQNFHNSNQEAVEHTESTELPEPIRLFVLSVIYPAYQGGATRLASLYTLYDRLQNQFPDYIPRLQQDYVFDTGRGEKTQAPILSHDENGDLHFRWMRAFLENGRDQTPHWDKSTDQMVEDISRLIGSIRIRMVLQQGDIGIFNNRAVLHARDPFENHPDHPPRWLLRSWFQ